MEDIHESSLSKRPTKLVVIGDYECKKKEILWAYISGANGIVDCSPVPRDWDECYTHVWPTIHTTYIAETHYYHWGQTRFVCDLWSDRFVVWTTLVGLTLSGIEEFAHVAYTNVDVFLVVYDVSRDSPSLANAFSMWIPEATTRGVPFAMLGVDIAHATDSFSVGEVKQKLTETSLDAQVVFQSCQCRFVFSFTSSPFLRLHPSPPPFAFTLLTFTLQVSMWHIANPSLGFWGEG